MRHITFFSSIFISILVSSIESNHHSYAFHVPKYHFAYGIYDPHTKDRKSQHETRDHDKVHGVYTVDEPDGTKRIVKYVADKHNGFRAFVQHIGHPVYGPEHGRHKHNNQKPHHHHLYHVKDEEPFKNLFRDNNNWF